MSEKTEKNTQSLSKDEASLGLPPILDQREIDNFTRIQAEAARQADEEARAGSTPGHEQQSGPGEQAQMPSVPPPESEPASCRVSFEKTVDGRMNVTFSSGCKPEDVTSMLTGQVPIKSATVRAEDGEINGELAAALESGDDKKFHRGFAPIVLSMNGPGASVKGEAEGGCGRFFWVEQGEGGAGGRKKGGERAGRRQAGGPVQGRAVDGGARERKDR